MLGGDWSRLPLPSQLSLENQLCASHEVKGTYESLQACPRLLKSWAQSLFLSLVHSAPQLGIYLAAGA